MRIYEINTRSHCRQFDHISAAELAHLSSIGLDAIWLMGVWQISDGAKKISRVISDDFEGSPFAVSTYQFDEQLGGGTQFQSLVERAHAAGLKVIIDFVSNHMALDSPWIDERPDFFIKSNPSARPQSTGDYFLHSSGEVLAFGRDPYFPPWHDTVQLDYTSESLRQLMIEVLKDISRVADGVRCDMAMLLLRDHVRGLWYPSLSQSWFDEKMPGEFWDQAIAEVKKERADFTFIAEAYWDKERQLLDLGFDLVYEKRLYDGLAVRDPSLVASRLMRDNKDLERSLCFIENHDEIRAATLFSNEQNTAAMALLLASPASVLIHEGQMEGRRERIPIQRVLPVCKEAPDESLQSDYLRLLDLTRASLFRDGKFNLFDCGVPGTIGFIRQDDSRTVVYVGQIGDRGFGTHPLDLTPAAQAVEAGSHLEVVDLMHPVNTTLEREAGRFLFRPPHRPAGSPALFYLLEIARR